MTAKELDDAMRPFYSLEESIARAEAWLAEHAHDTGRTHMLIRELLQALRARREERAR